MFKATVPAGQVIVGQVINRLGEMVDFGLKIVWGKWATQPT